MLVTEDKKTGMLKRILSQWPDLERKTAVWPTRGSSGLPPAESISGLRQLFGSHLKIILHRDSDFMLPEERTCFVAPYEAKSIKVWLTKGSDIESYWTDIEAIEDLLELPSEEAKALLNDAFHDRDCDGANSTFNTKRRELINKIPELQNGSMDLVGSKKARTKLQEHGPQHVYAGKDLITSLRKIAQERGITRVHKIGQEIPKKLHGKFAEDLRNLMQSC
jgi:hypothetical protein